MAGHPKVPDMHVELTATGREDLRADQATHGLPSYT